ncbi:MAG: hypothetical protein HUK20_12680 [Fibrobacter sp.]|nr:hypothetical protein [Fibrobacter sp.]
MEIKTYNNRTRNHPKFKDSYLNVFDGLRHQNFYVTENAAIKNIEALKIAGHKDIKIEQLTMLSM